MEPYDALLRDLQRVCTKPHGLIARAIAAIATLREQAKTWEERADYLRERCEDFRKRNDYLERVQTDRKDDQKFAQIRQEMAELRALLAESRAQRDEAKFKIERIMSGLEGCCMTCEPVGVRNQQMEQHIKTMQAERDEARREVSKLMGGSAEQHWYANRRGWDCFGESK
jgi:chromosome segregation ATPase